MVWSDGRGGETRPIIRDEYLNATRSVETAVEEWAGSDCVCA